VWLYAALGDVLYTFLIIGVMSLVKQDTRWLKAPGRADYAALSLLGLCAAVLVEYKAMLLHRWAYSAHMPTIFGLGLDPLLQMAILVPLCVYLASLLHNSKIID
jgi:hypothetical protein